MRIMGHHWNRNATFVIIALAFLLTKTSVCSDNDAGKTIAKVVVNNQTNTNNGTSNNGTGNNQKNTTVLKGEETHVKTTNVEGGKNAKGIVEHRTDGQEKNETNRIPLVHVPSLNPGALKRAFYVFAGLSVIVLIYLMIRSFGFKKNPAQMVRKYGILAHKQDMEMRPLPLDEDDEDDTTVFDISGLSPQRPQHQTS